MTDVILSLKKLIFYTFEAKQRNTTHTHTHTLSGYWTSQLTRRLKWNLRRDDHNKESERDLHIIS